MERSAEDVQARFVSAPEMVRPPDSEYEREGRVEEVIDDLEEGRDPAERDV